jgi:hypothetical protein
MPDLGAMLLRRSLAAVDATEASCSTCRRTPLPGERLHELDGGARLCDLCFAALPEPERIAVRSERVRVGERQLSVVTKAA